jgi:hypothetical protein
MSAEPITIESYSEKAIAVFGGSKPIKDHLASLGGKFNPSLRGNNENEKRAGWIFPKTKQNDVKQIIDKFNNGTLEPVVASGSEQTLQKPEHPLHKKSYSKSNDSEFYFSKEMYLAINTRLERLEAENELLKRIIERRLGEDSLKEIKPKIIKSSLKFVDSSSNDDVDDDEEEKVPTRLLSKRH